MKPIKILLLFLLSSLTACRKTGAVSNPVKPANNVAYKERVDAVIGTYIGIRYVRSYGVDPGSPTTHYYDTTYPFAITILKAGANSFMVTGVDFFYMNRIPYEYDSVFVYEADTIRATMSGYNSDDAMLTFQAGNDSVYYHHFYFQSGGWGSWGGDSEFRGKK